MAVEPAGKKKSFLETRREPERQQTDGNPWRYAFLGTQLAVSVLAGIFIGWKIDSRFATAPWGAVIGAFVGIAGGLYAFLRAVLKP